VRAYSAPHYVRDWLQHGELDSALRWARGRRLEDGDGLDGLALARVIIAGNPPFGPRKASAGLPDLASLRRLLEHRLVASEQTGWVDRTIELLILQALAWQADRDPAKAAAALRRALSLAREGRYIRRFVREGRPILLLLKTMEGKNGILDPYIAKLLAVGPGPESLQSALDLEPMIEPLSGRELEVLQLMALGDSNAEISAKLVITLNTTKKHVTHIFEKLDVANRSKAVIRARELGLLAQGP
jgi:LuxR family maltose regulon positive regulatory protein